MQQELPHVVALDGTAGREVVLDDQAARAGKRKDRLPVVRPAAVGEDEAERTTATELLVGIALEQLHVPVDYIVGTSMGSIVGGLYACGYTPDEMEKLIKSIHWDTLFQDAPERAQQAFRQKEDDFEHLEHDAGASRANEHEQ